MKPSTLTQQISRYRVPLDVLMDILRLLFLHKIPHKIKGIKEKENTLILEVDFSRSGFGAPAKENLEAILHDHAEYMRGLLGDATLLMDEDDEEDE